MWEMTSICVKCFKYVRNNVRICEITASCACKCSQIKTAEGAELKVEQRRGCIQQFSVNSDDDVVAFQLNIYNTLYCDKTLLITLCGKQKSTQHACLLSFVLVCIQYPLLRAFARHPRRYLQTRFSRNGRSAPHQL